MLNNYEDYAVEPTVNTSPLTPLKKDDKCSNDAFSFQKGSKFNALRGRLSRKIQNRLDPTLIIRLELAHNAYNRQRLKDEEWKNMTPMTPMTSSSPLPRMDQECMLDEYLKDFKDIPKLVPQDLSDKSIPISNAHTTNEVSQDLPEMDNLPDIEKLHIKDGHETDSLPSEFLSAIHIT